MAITDAQLAELEAVIDRSGLAPVLQRLADLDAQGRHRCGRPRRLGNIRGLLVAYLANAAQPDHRGKQIDVARQIHAMTPQQRDRLGLRHYAERTCYDQVHRFHRGRPVTWCRSA